MKTTKTQKLFFSAGFLFALFFGLENFIANASVSEPIAWWDFNNQSEISAGLVRDKKSVYNGQNFNGVSVSGFSGNALYFPGSGNGVGFTVASLPTLSSLTITFRMKTDNSTDATQWIILAQSISPTYGEINISYRNGILGVGVTQNGSAQAVLSVDQNYHYYAVSYDGRNIYIYVDGQIKAFSTAAGTGKITADKWSFASNDWISGHNKVELDDLKIYNRVLSEAEVSYENGNGQLCYADTWSCGEYTACSLDGTQTRNCSKTFECPLVEIPSPATSQSCTPPCEADIWSCGEWSSCSTSGAQTRNCSKTFECSSVVTPSPAISQSCTPPSQPPPAPTPTPTPTPSPTPPPAPTNEQPTQPSCSEDAWSCGEWEICSIAGIQSRNCFKTFDCPSVQTATPTTDRSCQPPSQSQPTQNSQQQEDTSFINSILEKLSPKKSETPTPPSPVPSKTETKEQTSISEKAPSDQKKTQPTSNEPENSTQEITSDQNNSAVAPTIEEPLKPSLIKRVILWLLSLF